MSSKEFKIQVPGIENKILNGVIYFSYNAFKILKCFYPFLFFRIPGCHNFTVSHVIRLRLLCRSRGTYPNVLLAYLYNNNRDKIYIVYTQIFI